MSSSKVPEDNLGPAATARHPDVFSATGRIIDQLHDWVHSTTAYNGTVLGVIKVAVLTRALNQFRAINNLLRTDHWEDALILTRSLFELLLNVEELLRADDPETSAVRFAHFWQCQAYLEWRALMEYAIATKRAGHEAQHELDEMEQQARRAFPEFTFVDKKGRRKWRASWCNKNVADLAQAGAPIRMHQYRLIYGRGSEFTHSTPAAVFTAMLPLTDPLDAMTKLRRVSHLQEEQGLREVGALASTFLVEITMRLGDCFKGYRPEWVLEEALPLIKRIGGEGMDRKGFNYTP